MPDVTTRIVCIGNRLVEHDAAGPAVHDLLARRALRPNVELIDGGLGGLNLIRCFEGALRVVVVDAVRGFAKDGDVVVLETEEIAQLADKTYGHSSGLPYLLRMLPGVIDGQMPEIFMVGIEGAYHSKVVARAADMSLRLAIDGTRPAEVAHAQAV